MSVRKSGESRNGNIERDRMMESMWTSVLPDVADSSVSEYRDFIEELREDPGMYLTDPVDSRGRASRKTYKNSWRESECRYRSKYSSNRRR